MHNLSHSVRKRLTRHLATFPHIKQTSDATFILDPRNWIDNRIISDVPFEAEQMAFVKRRVRELGISQVIDIGANFGLYTITLGKMPEIQSVIAFEPVNRNFNQLCGNVFANRLDSYHTGFNYYLGIPGSDLYNHVIKEKTYDRLDERGYAWVKVDGMSSDQMIAFHRWIKFLFHIMKPKRLFRLLFQTPPRAWIVALLKVSKIYKVRL